MCRVGNQRHCLLDYQTPIKWPLIANITSHYHRHCYCISLCGALFCFGKICGFTKEKKTGVKVEEIGFVVKVALAGVGIRETGTGAEQRGRCIGKTLRTKMHF